MRKKKYHTKTLQTKSKSTRKGLESVRSSIEKLDSQINSLSYSNFSTILTAAGGVLTSIISLLDGKIAYFIFITLFITLTILSFFEYNYFKKVRKLKKIVKKLEKVCMSLDQS